MRLVKTYIARLMVSFVMILAGLAHGQEPEYQDRRNDYPDTYTSFPLIHLDLKGGNTQISFLRYEQSGAGTKTRFETKSVPAGQELAIRGYWISKNLIEAYRSKYNKEKNTFYKGADFPSYDETLQAFRASENSALLEMLGKLTELRRSPESETEAREVRDILDPKHQQDPSEFHGQLTYGTGMIEVEDPSATGEEATKRRFIPLDLIRSGKIAVDAKQARVKILQSVLMTVVSDSLFQSKEKLESEIIQTIEQISCKASPCTNKGDVFSQVIDAILKNGIVDNATRFNIMDPKYDEKLNHAEKQKLEQILGDLRKLCLP